MPETIATFLATHELSSYAAACEEHGWDSLPALQAISDDDLKQLVADVEMKSGHAARLRSALGKAPPAAAAPPAQSTPGAVPAMPADPAAGQPGQVCLPPRAPWRPLQLRRSCTISCSR